MTGGIDGGRHRGPGLLQGLSGKVLVMTILFVMLGEILIFLPSIANFRIQWLKGRIAQAEIAALAAEAAPDRILSADLRTEILKGAGVLVVSLPSPRSCWASAARPRPLIGISTCRTTAAPRSPACR
jgi:hypothetical protein